MTRRTSRKPRRVRRTSLRRSSKYETPLELILRGWRPRVTSADVRNSKRLRPNATVGQLFAERLSAAAEYPDLSVSDAAHRLAYGFRGGLSGMIERLRHDPNGWSYWREGDALGLKKYKHDKVRKDVQTATRQSLDAWDALADKLLPNTSHDEYKRLHYEYAQAGQQVTRSEASLRKARELELRDPDFDLLYRRSARVAGELFSGRERLAAAKDAMRVAVGGPKRLRPNGGWLRLPRRSDVCLSGCLPRPLPVVSGRLLRRAVVLAPPLGKRADDAVAEVRGRPEHGRDARLHAVVVRSEQGLTVVGDLWPRERRAVRHELLLRECRGARRGQPEIASPWLIGSSTGRLVRPTRSVTQVNR